MNRITQEDVDKQFERLNREIQRWGLLHGSERLGMENGSKTNGRAYRLFVMISASSGHYRPPVGEDFLGVTLREAYNELASRSRTLEDARYALSRQGRWVEPKVRPS